MENINYQNNEYEEISLRELIEVILDGWKIIAIITAIAVIIATISSVFILNPEYESKAMITKSTISDRLSNLDFNEKDIKELLDSESIYPFMNINTYKDQNKKPAVLQAVINELNLDEDTYTTRSLKNMISLNPIEETDLIEIKVNTSDEELAQKITNTLLNKLQIAMDRMATKHEIEIYDYISKELNLKLEKQQSSIEATKKELEETPKFIITRKSLSEDPFMNQVASEEYNRTFEDAGEMGMISENLNSTYVHLSTRLSDLKINISDINKELEQFKTLKENKQKQFNTLSLENNKSTSAIKSSSIKIVSKATYADKVGPRSLLNIAIATVLGLMLGVFIVFFRHYWRSTES